MTTTFKVCVILALCGSLLMMGCGASNTVKGGGIGAAAGGILGGIIGHAAGNTAAGVIIGAVVGGAAGALIGHYMDKQAEEMRNDIKNAKIERVGEGIKITFDSGILFKTNSSDLQSTAETNIASLAKILNKYPDTNILVDGHTDSTGSAEYNMRLSERRAGSVADYMKGLAVAGSRISTRGFGETAPVASNSTADGRQQNRRVEVAIFANDKLKEAAANNQARVTPRDPGLRKPGPGWPALNVPRGLWIGLMAVLSVAGCRAQWIGDSAIEARTHRGIQEVYNLSFDSARAEFQFISRRMPDHPAGYFFLAMVDWWRIVTDIENTAYDDRFLSELDRVIDLCDKRLDKNEHDTAALFFKGGALGFRGRLHGNREDWLKAANDGRAALPIVEEAYKLAPENDDVLLGMGVYHYYAAVIPDLYPFVKPFMIFFPEGNKGKGLRELTRAAAKATYANIEATYFLLQVLQNYEKRSDQALPLALTLHAQFPNNPIFHKYVGRCYASVGNWDACAAAFAEILQRVRNKSRGYDRLLEREARYYLGIQEMNTGNYPAALDHFYRCDELSRALDRDPTGFMVSVNLKIGMIYDVQMKRELAVNQYRKVLTMDDYQGVHQQAERYLKTPYKNL